MTRHQGAGPGSDGNDVFQGGTGIDTYDLSREAAAVAINLAALFANGEGIGEDVVIGIENVLGGSGGDTLTGDGRANALNGNGGADRLRGGAGHDRLIGGAGGDWFEYGALAQGGDVIMDFEGGIDSLRFRGAAFGGLAAGALAASLFDANDAGQATAAGQRFVYESDTGILRFDADGSDAGAAIIVARLLGMPNLTLTDLIIF